MPNKSTKNSSQDLPYATEDLKKYLECIRERFPAYYYNQEGRKTKTHGMSAAKRRIMEFLVEANTDTDAILRFAKQEGIDIPQDESPLKLGLLCRIFKLKPEFHHQDMKLNHFRKHVSEIRSALALLSQMIKEERGTDWVVEVKAMSRSASGATPTHL